ncbi:MAG: HlyD family type I secretion periplasmic adaptor subunit [Nitrospira sp.]
MIFRHIVLWRTAWQLRSAQSSGDTTRKKAVEFLPAVLEIQDSPPSPIGRVILWTIIASFAVGVLWASLSRIDIVAVAPGKIIPSGHTKTIQPLEVGVVAAIHVQDGQIVKQGEILIELDPTQNRADRDRAVNEYRAAIIEAARLRAVISGQSTFSASVDADPQFVALQHQLLRDQLSEFSARADAARYLIDQRGAAVEATKENIRRLEATVPMEAERATAYRKLFVQQFVSKMDFLQFEQQRIDKAQELAGQRKKLRQDQAAWSEAERTYRAVISEFYRSKQAELAAIETKAASLSQDVRKAGQKAELQKLAAPIHGIVQQLGVHTVGGVVTPAQPLMIIVPVDHPVEVEARVENKDIGFVKEGQSVEIKVQTFPFTVYGTIPGNVLSVSDDAVSLDKEEGELVYVSRVNLERSTIQIEDRAIRLSPGMAVTVEIRTGQRRVMEYLLSPLLKSVQESMRER